MRLSAIYNMDIYSAEGQYVGNVKDLILDLQEGAITRLLLVPWKNMKGDPKRVLKEQSIRYESVKSVGDVVVVSGKQESTSQQATPEEINDLR